MYTEAEIRITISVGDLTPEARKNLAQSLNRNEAEVRNMFGASEVIGSIIVPNVDL